MILSDAFIYRANPDIDYDAESDNIVKSARKFSVVVYASCANDKLINYLLDSYYLFSECFEVCLLVNGVEIDIKRFKKIFPYLTIIQFLQVQKEYELLQRASEIIESDYFMFIPDCFVLRKIDFKKVENLFLSYKNPICVTPIIFDDENDIFPSIRMPSLTKDGKIAILSLPLTHRVENTLYPINSCGAYSRKAMEVVGKFIKADNYPSTIDYFVRAHLMGYTCTSYDEFCVSCASPDKLIEIKLDKSNMSVVNLNALCFKKSGNNRATTNLINLFSYSFKDVRQANKNNSKYLYDYKTLVENWRLSEDEALSALQQLAKKDMGNI